VEYNAAMKRLSPACSRTMKVAVILGMFISRSLALAAPPLKTIGAQSHGDDLWLKRTLNGMETHRERLDAVIEKTVDLLIDTEALLKSAQVADPPEPEAAETLHRKLQSVKKKRIQLVGRRRRLSRDIQKLRSKLDDPEILAAGSVLLRLVGPVELRKPKRRRWRRIYSASGLQALKPGSRIRTMQGARLFALLDKGHAELDLRSLSEFRILNKRNSKDSNFTMYFRKGTALIKNTSSDSEEHRGRFAMKTPRVALLVSSARYLIRESKEKGSEITVLSGVVEVSDAKGEKTVSLEKGFRIRVPPDGGLSEPEEIDLTQLKIPK